MVGWLAALLVKSRENTLGRPPSATGSIALAQVKGLRLAVPHHKSSIGNMSSAGSSVLHRTVERPIQSVAGGKAADTPIAPAQPARPTLLILGTRGIPARHGGFETFAEKFALHMVSRGWEVTVYCQREVTAIRNKDSIEEVDEWRGVRRVSIAVAGSGPGSTIAFDWRCIRHACGLAGVPLVLGYNTACFLLLLRAQGRPVITNMDGIEWKRRKWSLPQKAWLRLNERAACIFSTNVIADHPEIRTSPCLPMQAGEDHYNSLWCGSHFLCPGPYLARIRASAGRFRGLNLAD